MSVNPSRCYVIGFNAKTDPPTYKLGDTVLTGVGETTHLGVTIQSDLKFSPHIAEQNYESNEVLSMLRRDLYDAPRAAKLIAYTAVE